MHDKGHLDRLGRHVYAAYRVPAMPVLGFSTACVQGVGTLLANIWWLS